jgi:tyrosine-protein kinase
MASNPERQERPGFLTLLSSVRRRIGIVLICMVVVPAAAFALSLSEQKQYSASASLLFRDPAFDQKLFGSTVVSSPTDPTREAATNVQLVSLQVISARTAKALKGRLTPDQIQSEVTVSPAGQSDVVTVTATDPRPPVAAQLANTFAKEFIAFRRDADRSKIASAQQLVQAQLGKMPATQRAGTQGTALKQRAEQLQILAALQTGNAELVQPATVPGSPSSPRPLRNTAVGLLLGVLLGLGLAVLLERLDRRLKDPRDISEAFDRPVLGGIPGSRALSIANPAVEPLAGADAEAFRMLRANFLYFNVDREVDSVLITSSTPGDGKSTVSLHLAFAAATAGSRVLLIEADLRHPTLGRRLGLPADRGLSQLLAGQIKGFSQAVHRVPVPTRRSDGVGAFSLDALLSGPIPPNPADLIESDRMQRVLEAARERYDLVVIDTPPTSVVSDTIPLVKRVSGVIVVCRLGRTTRDSARHLREQLENLEANLLGVVVNGIGRQTAGYGYGYAYGYGYTSATDAAAPAATNGRRRDAQAAAEVGNGRPTEERGGSWRRRSAGRR